MHDTSSIVQLTDLSRSVSNFDVILFYMYTSIVKGLVWQKIFRFVFRLIHFDWIYSTNITVTASLSILAEYKSDWKKRRGHGTNSTNDEICIPLNKWRNPGFSYIPFYR